MAVRRGAEAEGKYGHIRPKPPSTQIVDDMSKIKEQTDKTSSRSTFCFAGDVRPASVKKQMAKNATKTGVNNRLHGMLCELSALTPVSHMFLLCKWS